MTKHLLLLLLLFSACCRLHTEVKYNHDDVTITRIDECGKTTFYYNNGQENSSGKIWTEYSGINDGFSGYLEFCENGKVFLLSGDGYFQSENIDSSKFEYKRIFSYDRPKIGESVCEIQLSTRYEKEENDKSKTGIKITYKIDDNEWW